LTWRIDVTSSLPFHAQSPRSLAGRGILVTRPRGQAAHLAGLIEAAAGRPVVFPAIEILDAPDSQALARLIEQLDRFDIAIFVSPTAVTCALALIRAQRALPQGLRIAAIGKGTARELARAGVERILVPDHGGDSEALLALPELMTVAGSSIVVFRGEGGRELLGNTLAARGATVEYAQCYRRARPRGDAQSLLDAWAHGQIDAVTATSAEAVRNLYELLAVEGRQVLRQTPLFAPHERIATAARALGIVQVVVTAAGDEGLVEGMIEYFSGVART
jgi:uroporphyrinogen-III synthase